MYTLFGHETRPITRRYLDPLELVWYSTARKLGIRLGRNPDIFSMSDGTGLLELGTRDTLTDAQGATRKLHDLVTPFLASYQSDVPDDVLPSLWDQSETSRLPEPSAGSTT